MPRLRALALLVAVAAALGGCCLACPKGKGTACGSPSTPQSWVAYK